MFWSSAIYRVCFFRAVDLNLHWGEASSEQPSTLQQFAFFHANAAIGSFTTAWSTWKPVQSDGHLDCLHLGTPGCPNNSTGSCIRISCDFLRYRGIKVRQERVFDVSHCLFFFFKSMRVGSKKKHKGPKKNTMLEPAISLTLTNINGHIPHPPSAGHTIHSHLGEGRRGRGTSYTHFKAWAQAVRFLFMFLESTVVHFQFALRVSSSQKNQWGAGPIAVCVFVFLPDEQNQYGRIMRSIENTRLGLKSIKVAFQLHLFPWWLRYEKLVYWPYIFKKLPAHGDHSGDEVEVIDKTGLDLKKETKKMWSGQSAWGEEKGDLHKERRVWRSVKWVRQTSNSKRKNR